MRVRTRLLMGMGLFLVFVVALMPTAFPDAEPVARWRGYRITKQEPKKPVPPSQTAVVADIRVNKTVVPNVRAMVTAARKSGVWLEGDGYRSTETQMKLRRINGCPDIWSSPSTSCRIPTAIPGRSQHEAGLAIDFNNCSTRSTACYKWLAKNARKYGFYNYEAEPWHWSTSGR